MRYKASLIGVLLLLLIGGSQVAVGISAQTPVLNTPTEGLSADMAFPVSLAVSAATNCGCESFGYLSNDELDDWLPMERKGVITERAYLKVINPTTSSDSCFGHKERISITFLL